MFFFVKQNMISVVQFSNDDSYKLFLTVIQKHTEKPA